MLEVSLFVAFIAAVLTVTGWEKPMTPQHKLARLLYLTNIMLALGVAINSSGSPATMFFMIILSILSLVMLFKLSTQKG